MENLKDRSVTDQPREKMLQYGPVALSDTELLAILIGTGTRELPVLALSDKVLAVHNHSLETLGETTLNDLLKIKGIGAAKGAIIQAAIELGRRRLALQSKTPKIKTEEDAIRLVDPYFKSATGVLFLLVLLNRNYELLATSELKLTDALPNVQQILEIVIEAGAYSFGIVRNAITCPENAESKLLTDLDAAAKMLNLKYLGRIIMPTQT